MDTAKIFTNGRSQAVRLPKDYRIQGKEAFITKIGDSVLLIPKKEKWDSLFDSLTQFSDDFMDERAQPEVDEREKL